MTVSYRYASFAEIDGLLKTPRKSLLGRRHEQFAAEIYVGDYVKFPSVAVNYDKMEVSPKGLKQEMSVFSVPVNSGSLIGFENRRNNDGVVVGLYCEVAGYFEQQYIPFDLPRHSLNTPPTEEVRLRGSFIIRMPLEYIKATAYAYAYAYDSFDNKRRGGLFNVFIVNNQLYFLTKELSVVVGTTHIRSSRDLHPLSHVRCLPEEVLKATLSIRDTVHLSLCRAAQSQGVTDCKEIYMTRTAWLTIMHDMQAFPHSPYQFPSSVMSRDGLYARWFVRNEYLL
jgi:hypothetical protein